MAEELDQNVFDAIIAVGGDGTLLEILNGLGSERIHQVPVGVIPGGSGNGISACLGWLDAASAAVGVSAGEFSTIDTFEWVQVPSVDNMEAGVTKGFMFLMLTWGMLSDIDLGSDKWRWMGPARFTVMGALLVVSNEPYPCEIYYAPEERMGDGPRRNSESEVRIENGEFVIPRHFQVIRDPFFFCAASGSHIATTTRIAPPASLTDRKLWLVTASDLNFPQRCQFLIGIEDGSHHGKPGVRCIPTQELIVVPHKHPQIVDIDGEVMPNAAIWVKLTDHKPRFAS
eukprot:TRINITY_DN11335_c1_g2_i1.p1 TRINITY_DN11335_c1_g2~~TRINITY_DN11335_c1_g2_i1.p1  ORF type:complete len:285 (-),score=71.68 TRINITY_DN11335_c1_g2_i1:13-867(-)